MNSNPTRMSWRQRIFWLLLIVIFGYTSLHMYILSRIPAYNDFWLTVFYRPTEQVQTLQDSLDLTWDGAKIWSATNPEYKTAEEFNDICESHDASVNVLGCYLPDSDRIFLYEVTNPRLVDANKVTVAHELLHAVWERLSYSEQQQISAILMRLYEEDSDRFDEELKIYPENEKIGEMYTRAGTKLADLPAELEDHYGKYFNDRAKIVAYYENYQAPFNELTERANTLNNEIERLDAEIEAARNNYRDGVAAQNAAIAEFNRCADTPGCFSEYAFNNRRAALTAESERLESIRNQLNSKIDEYNNKLEQYRDLNLEMGNLYNDMNSNIELEHNSNEKL